MHDCPDMREALEHDVAVVYIPKFREYGIRILDGGSSYKVITHCPWCGEALPASLRDQWFDRIEQLGLELDNEVLPLELRTDAWWQALNE